MNKGLQIAILSLVLLLLATIVIPLSIGIRKIEAAKLSSGQTKRPELKQVENIPVESYSFADAFRDADIVADVAVEKVLEETSSPQARTFFKAKVNTVYKNAASGSIRQVKFMQLGNSKLEACYYPVFKEGEHLLLFLKNTGDAADTYSILGEYTTVFKVRNIGGTDYYIKVWDDDLDLALLTANGGPNKETIRKFINEQMPEYDDFKNLDCPVQVFEKQILDEKLLGMSKMN